MKTKAPFITLILDQLFPNPLIPLQYTSAFSLLVAVVLSAQCTDEKVNKVTPILFREGNTPEAMLKLGFDQIASIIQPLGLYRTKASHIIKLSQKLLDEYKGKVPANFQELESLPGVGHKTASCMMSQCFKKPAFPVDTHIHRLAKRWHISEGRSVKQSEEDLKKFFPEKNWGKIHLQMIYYARKFCPAKKHRAHQCPICLALSLEPSD